MPPLRILIVDDDPLVIKALRDTLEADNHSVTTADGGQAGIDAFLAAKAQGDAFPIVITDLGMPYVDGRKVSNAVKTAAPETIVLLLTGWGQRLVDDGDVPAHVDRVLSKPPKLRELLGGSSRVTYSVIWPLGSTLRGIRTRCETRRCCMGRTSTSEIAAVRKLVAQLPPDSKRHVEAVAAALREFVAADDTQEAELAFTPVLAELV